MPSKKKMPLSQKWPNGCSMDHHWMNYWLDKTTAEQCWMRCPTAVSPPFGPFKAIIFNNFVHPSSFSHVRFGRRHLFLLVLAISYGSNQRWQTLGPTDSDIQCDVKNLRLRCHWPLKYEAGKEETSLLRQSRTRTHSAPKLWDFFWNDFIDHFKKIFRSYQRW